MKTERAEGRRDSNCAQLQHKVTLRTRSMNKTKDEISVKVSKSP